MGGEGNKEGAIAGRGIQFVKIFREPDGSFPHGIPNPLLPENRDATAKAVIESGADIGVAWDGDFDRCFLFDENGKFIEGYYIVGLLSGGDAGEASGRENNPRPAPDMEHS